MWCVQTLIFWYCDFFKGKDYFLVMLICLEFNLLDALMLNLIRIFCWGKKTQRIYECSDLCQWFLDLIWSTVSNDWNSHEYFHYALLSMIGYFIFIYIDLIFEEWFYNNTERLFWLKVVPAVIGILMASFIVLFSWII